MERFWIYLNNAKNFLFCIKNMAKKKELLKNISLLLVTILILFLILEIILRIILPTPFNLVGLKTEDGLLGFKMVPNFSGRHTGPEFDVTVNINSLGLRNPEIGEKTKDRILILGDSVVWGFGVEDDETFPYLLNEMLYDYEVVNAGVSAYSTKQELDYLKRDGIKLNPDIVILGFYVGNDFIDNLVRKENSSVKQEASWFAKTKAKIRENYKTYPFFMDNLKKIYIIRSFLVKTGLANNEEYYQYQVYRKEYPPELTEGTEITFEYISEINSFCKERNIEFILLLIPSRYQAYDEAWQFLLDYNHFNDNEHEKKKPNKLLVNFANGENITYIDLLNDLQDQEEQFYLENDVAHFNPEGHKFIAKKLSEEF